MLRRVGNRKVRVRRLIGLTFVAIALAGCSGSPAPTPIIVYVTPVPTFTASNGAAPTATMSFNTQQPAEGEAPVVLEGSSDITTAPFELTGGDYRATITVEGPACFWSGYVMAVGSGELDTPTMGLASVSLSTDEPGPKTVETFEYGVPAGSYFLSVGPGASGCPWRVEIGRAP